MSGVRSYPDKEAFRHVRPKESSAQMYRENQKTSMIPNLFNDRADVLSGSTRAISMRMIRTCRSPPWYQFSVVTFGHQGCLRHQVCCEVAQATPLKRRVVGTQVFQLRVQYWQGDGEHQRTHGAMRSNIYVVKMRIRGLSSCQFCLLH